MDPIDIPIQLDPTLWMNTSYKKMDRYEYELRCVIHHKGRNAGSGHYVTDVRNDGVWTRYDDSIVQELEDHVVQGTSWHQTAYLLFYTSKESLS